MSLIVPTVGEVLALQRFLKTEALNLKLYSNNVIPAEGDTSASYTDVVGGGYVSKNLVAANWVITAGDPSYGLYAAQDFTFTGATGGSGLIYGYFVVNAGNTLLWAERFPSGVIPFAPVAGSLIRVTPRLECS